MVESDYYRMSGLQEPLLQKAKTQPKKVININKLTDVVNDENMLQIMERNLTLSTNTSFKVIPSNRELNDLVTSTNLQKMKQPQVGEVRFEQINERSEE